MAPTVRPTQGMAPAFVLAVTAGSVLEAGPAPSQRTTEDGMGGNETMSDGNETMDDDDSMDGPTETTGDGESMSGGTETMAAAGTGGKHWMDAGNESMGDQTTAEEYVDGDSTTEEESMAGDRTTDEDRMTVDETGDDRMTGEAASDGQPGFGVVVRLAAMTAAGFAFYRRRG